MTRQRITALAAPFFTALLACLALALPARATTVLPLYLDEIVQKAAVAFQGTCTANRTERDPQTGMIVTYTTFQVDDALKGGVGSTYTIKQIGGELPGEAIQYKVQGVPKFNVGQGYVVFLPAASSAGFSSPVGLSQGRFLVEPDPAGPQVSNGRDFREMTARIPADQLPPAAKAKIGQAPGPVRRMGLDEFKQLVRTQASAQSAASALR
jgi:hypothetical protein